MSFAIDLPACLHCGGATVLARPDTLAQPEPVIAVRCQDCGATIALDAETSAAIRRAAEVIVREAVEMLQQWARVVQAARLQVAAGTASAELVAALDHLDAYWADSAASETARRDAVERVLRALNPPSED